MYFRWEYLGLSDRLVVAGKAIYVGMHRHELPGERLGPQYWQVWVDGEALSGIKHDDRWTAQKEAEEYAISLVPLQSLAEVAEEEE